MQVIMGVEALVPPLTGIGRYTWELASRLGGIQGLSPRYLRNGVWVSLDGQPASKTSQRLPRAVRDWYFRRIGKRAVFHGPNYFVPPWAELSVATIHDLSVFKFPETHPIERVRQFERLFDESINRARVLLTDSEAVRDELLAHTGVHADSVVSIPLGVGAAYRPLDKTEWTRVFGDRGLRHKGYVLCVSTLDPRKNIDKLLVAYRLMPDAIRRAFPLVLAGADGWAGNELHKALGDAEAQGWLYRLGYVHESELPALMAGAALFAFPSRYEGFGLPMIEAMASGVPVISSDIRVLRDVSLGLANYVDPDDIAAFALMIQHCLEDVRVSRSAAAAVEPVAQAYSWNSCFERTLEIYRRVAELA